MLPESPGDRASMALEEADTADRVEADRQRLRRRLKGGVWMSLAIAGGAAIQAWPGGLLYALSWFTGFVGFGVVLAIPPLRELRALEAEEQRRLLAEKGQ